MAVTGRGQERRKEGHFVLCAVLSLGLVPPAGAWTYHYGDQSELTWWQARKYCQEWYTDLVAIQNQGEIAYLNEFLPFHRTYYWIGIRKINNTWTWVGTQKPLTKEAENWAAREPNNRGANQDCVEIYIKRQREAGKWNDERCTRLKRALCYNASCQPFPCNERSECVETIGSYSCRCLPGFFGLECESAVQCRPLNIPAHGNIRCSHLYGEFQYRSECNFRCAAGFLIRGAENTVCDASGEWSSPEPACQVKQCQEIEKPTRGTMDCVNPMGNFAYNSTCDFACEPGFQLNGSKTLRCDAFGQWTSQVPFCDAISCPMLLAPENGELNCLHPYGDSAYGSLCNFSCHAGFLRVGTEQLRCSSEGRWTEKPPFCKAKRCPSLQGPANGRLACAHPLGVFALRSTCEAVCEPGFVPARAAAARCLATGGWSAPSPACTAVVCPALHKPDHGRFRCLHPHGNFVYGSSCNFSCSAGFQLAGAERLECTAQGDWTEKQPRCEAVQCPALESPANGGSNCSHPYGHFAYHSSCVFSCRSGFELLGPEMLNCTDQGNWTGEAPTCEATRCPRLLAPLHGHMDCAHPHGAFSFDSGCRFSCDVGFARAGPETLQCTPLGQWTRAVPTCEAVRCLQLKQGDHMRLHCSNPWAPFSYRSSCEFSCTEGYFLNGTKRTQCQADGSWSAKVPLCQENVASSLTQVLRYTGGVAASVIGLVVLGTLIVLAIKRLSRREGKKQLLSQTSDLGAPGVFTNAAYDTFS